MSFDILISLLGGLLSLAAGGIASSKIIQKIVLKLLGKSQKDGETYSSRLKKHINDLTVASKEVDRVLLEINDEANSRLNSIKELQNEIGLLESNEIETKDRIEALKKIPLPAVEHLAELIESKEKKTSKRDYVLFGAGVISTTIIAILLKIFKIG